MIHTDESGNFKLPVIARIVEPHPGNAGLIAHFTYP
jgi:hypothetical protein